MDWSAWGLLWGTSPQALSAPCVLLILGSKRSTNLTLGNFYETTFTFLNEYSKPTKECHIIRALLPPSLELGPSARPLRHWVGVVIHFSHLLSSSVPQKEVVKAAKPCLVVRSCNGEREVFRRYFLSIFHQESYQRPHGIRSPPNSWKGSQVPGAHCTEWTILYIMTEWKG